MSESNLEGEPRERCKEAKFVDDNFAELIQSVTSVMAIADELKSKGMLHGEKYDEIKAEKTNQGKMRKLFDSLKSGDEVKIAIYNLLEKHEPHLFKDLGGVRRKRKLADPESPVPCKKLNTESNEQNNPNFNSASPSAPRPAPIHVVTHIVNERSPSNDMSIIPILKKMEWKTQAPKKVKTPAPTKVKTPAPKKVKTPALKKVKTPAPKKAKKTPAPKKVKTPAPKKAKKTAAPKKAKKTPAPKKAKKTAAPKKAKKTAAPKKVKKTQKVKKSAAPKKVKRAAARK